MTESILAKRCAQLAEVIADYAQHDSWRCAYPDRYPWTPDCPCGLTRACREAGLPEGWIATLETHP